VPLFQSRCLVGYDSISGSSPKSVQGRSVGCCRHHHSRRRCVCSVGCTTRIVPMLEVALSRTTGKPGIGGPTVVLNGAIFDPRQFAKRQRSAPSRLYECATQDGG
jgi:hypothetical protein